MLHIHFVKVDHESLLVIGSLGIQVSASYASGRETTKFIEMGKIKDIVINEAIYMVRSPLRCSSHAGPESCHLCKSSELRLCMFLATDHLLPLCAAEGPLRAQCSRWCCATVSGTGWLCLHDIILFTLSTYCMFVSCFQCQEMASLLFTLLEH